MPPRVRAGATAGLTGTATPRFSFFSLMIFTAVVVAVASVMVASLGVATSGFTLVLITPVLVIVGLVFMFHQRFTFVEGLTFVLALIGALSTASWFLWFPIGNAFLVQYTIFHKPASPSYYDPAFAPVNASELILAMDVGISGDRFVALVGAKGIGKSTEMEFICSTLSRAIHVPWTDESQKTIPEILSTKLWGDASVFLKIVNVVWGHSVLCMDVKHKSRTIDIFSREAEKDDGQPPRGASTRRHHHEIRRRHLRAELRCHRLEAKGLGTQI